MTVINWKVRGGVIESHLLFVVEKFSIDETFVNSIIETLWKSDKCTDSSTVGTYNLFRKGQIL